MVAREIEFDWDDENRKHLAAHKVAPAEVEQMLNNDPVDLAYDLIDSEKRTALSASRMAAVYCRWPGRFATARYVP
jgi:hypothetical protein